MYVCEQYARHLARNKPFQFSQVDILYEEALNIACIFYRMICQE